MQLLIYCFLYLVPLALALYSPFIMSDSESGISLEDSGSEITLPSKNPRGRSKRQRAQSSRLKDSVNDKESCDPSSKYLAH